MKKMASYTKTKKKRIASIVVAVVTFFACLPIMEPSDWIIPLKVFAESRTFNTYAALEDFAANYTGANANDTITIAISEGGDEYAMNGFAGIGSSSAPFAGEIIIESGVYKRFNLNAPLFNYISTDAQLTINGDPDCITLTASTNTNRPLFAQHVVKGSNPVANWKVTLANHTDTEGTYANNYGGLIGDIADECTVNLEVTNNMSPVNDDDPNIANPNITTIGSAESDKNAGLICGTLGDDSILNVTINSGTATTYSVTSPTNAGGIIGEMESGSQLILNDAGLNAISQTITGDYAGGIVGKAVDAYIGTTSPDADAYMTISSDFLTASTTLSGVSGSGYLFGYYKNTNVNTAVEAVEEDQERGIEAQDAYTRDARKIRLDGFTGLSVSSTNNGNAGGLIGVLVHEPTSAGASFVIDGGLSVSESTVPSIANLTFTIPTNKANCGGIIGQYKTNNLLNTLAISDTYTVLNAATNNNAIGGIIGYVDDTASAAYISISDVYTRKYNDNSNGGGLIGTAGVTTTKGSFVDVSGYAKVHGKFAGGLVYSMNYGVMRIAGTTDLSALTAGHQILNTRDMALVYSRGTGSNSAWKLVRPSSNLKSNDIGSWGEVLRLTETGLTDNSIISEANFASTHTVSLQPPTNYTSIDALDDFVLLALNICHNTDKSTAALTTDSTATYKSAALLADQTIAFANGSTIDLSNTGIMGLTRDNGDQTFTGKISGGTTKANASTLTLAIGKSYGVTDLVGAAVSASGEGYGKIYNHAYSGLLAKTSGAEVSNLTIDGTQRMGINGANMHFGAVSALSEGGDKTSGVTSNVTIYVSTNSDNRMIAGGFIGRTNTSASGNIEFTNCATTAAFLDNTRRADDKPESYFGGYIALVDASGGAKAAVNNPLTISFGTNGGTDTCAVGGSYKSEYSTASLNTIYGGLIGAVRGNNSHAIFNSDAEPKAFRTINAYSVTVDGLSIDSKTDTASGGLLGYAWHDAEVNLQNVNIGGTTTNTVKISGGNGQKLAGLVYDATGHWSVGNVSIDKVIYTAQNASSSLGLLVNSTVNECRLNIDNDSTAGCGYAQDKAAGLYLEILNKSNYIVGNTTALSIDAKITTFDEIAAFSKHPDKTDIASNGHSIISINTDGSGTGVTMTGSACNTYQNQSFYGKNTEKVNSNTRYYYNLNAIRTKTTKTNAEKLLLWSVAQYAHGVAVKEYFDGTRSGISVTTISDSENDYLDMLGLSYYPVDYSGGLTFDTILKLKFYNDKIETAEGLGGNGNTDGVIRSTTNTDSKSQHYMMHCGLFRNVTSNISLADITMEGSVGIISSGSGFLACGTVGGGDSVITVGNGESNTIVFNNASVNGASSSGFAPLFIANVDSNTTLNVNGVKTQGYTTPALSSEDGVTNWYAATSLIGKAGRLGDNNTTPSTNMKLSFSKISLDSRTQDITDADNTRMSNVYGSTRTVFKSATLLHWYLHNDNQNCSGVYNYTHDEDWGTTNSLVNHNVTYGQEIISTKDYGDEGQDSYFGSSIYTDPTTGNASAPYTAFNSAAFIPYVANIGNASDVYHELKINHGMTSVINGCGTYNDPYKITDGAMLKSISSILNGGTPDADFRLVLPTDIATNYSTGDVNLRWCSDTNHNTYKLSGSNYSVVSGSGNTYSAVIVQKYLAGAYYEIDNDINVSSGLSGILNYTAFRGVIVGKQFTDTEGVTRYPNVTLTTKSPFIPTSNGSVVKNLNFIVNTGVTVDVTQEITSGSAPAAFEYNGGCSSYGVVMGKIMGGDNVIDAVGVTFNGTITDGENAYIVPVGGYVGVVVNGGLFFRNMSNSSVTSVTGLGTTGNFAESETKFLYHNPIIGRVINGYAVTEGSGYVPSAASQTMKNGTKNYAITDIDKNECVGGSGANNILDVQNAVAASGDSPAQPASIKVPNAQAWFLMSCIVNSGTGVTSGSNVQAGSTLSYSQSDFKSTHIGTYEFVGTSTNTDYNIINTCQEMSNLEACIPYILYKYTSVEKNQTANYKRLAKTLGGTARTIIMNPDYTNKDSSNYQKAATWTLPDGYRGIGGLNDDNKGFNISVSGLTSNSTTINLNMKYQTYLRSAAQSSLGWAGALQENYYPDANTQNSIAYDMGFGLFNVFKPSTALTISNLTLKGNIYIETLDKETGASKDYYGNLNSYKAYEGSSRDIMPNSNGRVSAGMFAGVKYDKTNKLTLNNVTLDTINVHSSRCSGGMIGMAALVDITSCTATNVSVLGKWDTGGYIGMAVSGAVSISGASATNKTIVNVADIIHEAVGLNFDAGKRPAGVGGLVGKADIAVTISNINLTKSGSRGYVEKNINHEDETCVGGFIGMVKSGNANISSCTLSDLSIVGRGANVGGVAGGLSGGSLTIDDVLLDGTNSVEGISVTYRLSAGGIVGKSNTDINIYNTQLKNYRIQKTESSLTAGNNNVSCGIGILISAKKIIFKNFLIDNCTMNMPHACDSGALIGYCNNDGTCNILGYDVALNDIKTGNSIVGQSTVSTEASDTKTIDGTNYYKISNKIDNKEIYVTDTTVSPISKIFTISGSTIKDVTATYSDNYYKGDIYGTAKNTNGLVKLVGFSRQSTPTDKLYGTNPTANSSSYIIFSDYSGTGFTGVDNKSKAKLDGTEAIMVDTAVPYATVNPALSFFNVTGHQTSLTGDGIAATKPSSAIYSIVTDLKNNTSNKRYSNAANYYKTFTGSDVGTSPSAASYYNANLSTFNNEWGTGTVSQDFVVLNLEDSKKNNATAMINSYINLLANTKYNYAESSSIYTVSIYKMQLTDEEVEGVKDGTYDYFTATLSDGTKAEALQAANLKWDQGNKQFYMLNDSPDSTESAPTFTLIDVAFKDPTNTSKIAYHLYVPIYVKKMMKYNFRIASGTGSSYERNWYNTNNRWGKIAIENYGSPITMYFEYEYERTLGEWKNAVSYGDTLLSNYAKKLSAQASGVSLADDSILVLIDRNDNNKLYYARASEAFEGTGASRVINLQKFTTELDETSGYFSPVTLQSMLERKGYAVTAARDDTNGTYQMLYSTVEGQSVAISDEATAISAGATIKASIGGNTRFFRLITGDEDPAITEKYALSITTEAADSTQVNLTESYFITIFSQTAYTATLDNENGTYQQLATSEGATIKASLNGTEYYFKPIDEGDTPDNKYAISTVSAIVHDTIGHSVLGTTPTPSKLDTTNTADDLVHIVFGEVINQTVHISQPDVTDPVVKLSENDTVKAKIETTMTVPDPTIRGLMNDSSVNVYQSFLVYMTKHDTDGSTVKEIIGQPVTSGTFTVKDGADNILLHPTDENGDPVYNGDTQVTAFTFSSMTDTGNYVEFATGKDIKSFLLSAGSSVKIEANVNLLYNGESKIGAQFPPRVDAETETAYYTVISGASHIAYDINKTAYSKTSEDATLLTGATPLLHYYTKASKSAKLDYNAYADENGVYGQLGINARANEMEVKNGQAEIKTLAVYDVSDIIQNVPLATYDMVRCTFEVQQKQNDGTYSDPLTISNYMSDVYLDGFKRLDEIEESETADYTRIMNNTKYTFEIERTKIVEDSDTTASIMSIPITFDVYSGVGKFETDGRMYSNYKVFITVELYDADAPDKPVHTMKKYIVYTNAKLISDFIE